MTRDPRALVQKVLSATDTDMRAALAYELLEAMYEAESLEVLEPLYQSSDPDHARIMVSMLYEHGNRSDDFVRWIDAYLDHDDEYVRLYAAGFATGLDPTQHPHTVSKLIACLGDTPLISANVAAYLSRVNVDDLDHAREHLSGELRELIGWLQEGKYNDWKRLYRKGGISALIAVAALGPELPTGAERLEDARRSDDESVALAARRISERPRS